MKEGVVVRKILQVDDLHVSFKMHNDYVRAIRGVSFDLYKGETLAIVGESGSGKSVTTKVLMGILAKNGNIDSGEVWMDDKDITKLSKKKWLKLEGKT